MLKFQPDPIMSTHHLRNIGLDNYRKYLELVGCAPAPGVDTNILQGMIC